MDNPAGISTMRLYGASIAIVSGVYFGQLAVTGIATLLGASWFMLRIGIVLLTPLSNGSQPLAARSCSCTLP